MYKELKSITNEVLNNVIQRIIDGAYIPFDQANSDYQKFKSDLVAGVELQDANGVAMSAADIQKFLAGLK